MCKEQGVEEGRQVGTSWLQQVQQDHYATATFQPRPAEMAGSHLCLRVCGHRRHQSPSPCLPSSVLVRGSRGDAGTASPQGPGSPSPRPSSRTAAPPNWHGGQSPMALLPEPCVTMRTIGKVNVNLGSCTIRFYLHGTNST